MGRLDGGLSAYIGNYPLAFVGSFPRGPAKRRCHFRSHLRDKCDRRLSLFSFFLYTAGYILFGDLRTSGGGSRAITETSTHKVIKQYDPSKCSLPTKRR